jgi:hypothetical protein
LRIRVSMCRMMVLASRRVFARNHQSEKKKCSVRGEVQNETLKWILCHVR